MASAPADTPKRRVRKRLLIPSVLLALMALSVIWLWWRGTFADTQERNPASATDGPVTQLLTKDGRTFVRAAVVVDAAPAAVWQVVTDYNNHPKFLPYIAELSSQKTGDGRMRLIGVARTHVWVDWPFEIDVRHTEDPEQGAYVAAWHEENKNEFKVNRGDWTVNPHGAGQTLLIFTKQSELSGYPNFLIRNILMNRVGALMRGMRDEVAVRRRGA
jgi:ribosome-associated toxin RatA of RatAB toxin-antitoxin module